MGDYALHTVIIKKPIDLEEAKRIAGDIIKDKTKNFYRETNGAYRFRNISKQKFKPKTFRSKKIRGRPIVLVFGELKPEFGHLKGSGILDFFKEKAMKVKDSVFNSIQRTFSPRLTDYPKKTRDMLNKYGNQPVKSLTIYRTPISSLIDNALNLISFGKWGDLKKRYGFDKLFHLALIANVGGKNLVIEKNEVVNVSTNYKTNDDTETLDVPLNGKSFTIYEMMEKARNKVGDKTFFDYDAFNNNCQFFIRYLLEAEDLYSPEVEKFVFQDLKKIYEGLPSYVAKTAKAITTTGAVVSKLSGNGEAEGGSRASGYIAAIMAGKPKKDPKRFKKYLEEGFKVEKLKRASPNLILQRATTDFYDFVRQYFNSYDEKTPNLVDIKRLWLLYLNSLSDSKREKLIERIEEIKQEYETEMKAVRKEEGIKESERMEELSGWVNNKISKDYADIDNWTEKEKAVFKDKLKTYNDLWRGYIEYIKERGEESENMRVSPIPPKTKKMTKVETKEPESEDEEEDEEEGIEEEEGEDEEDEIDMSGFENEQLVDDDDNRTSIYNVLLTPYEKGRFDAVFRKQIENALSNSKIPIADILKLDKDYYKGHNAQFTNAIEHLDFDQLRPKQWAKLKEDDRKRIIGAIYQVGLEKLLEHFPHLGEWVEENKGNLLKPIEFGYRFDGVKTDLSDHISPEYFEYFRSLLEEKLGSLFKVMKNFDNTDLMNIYRSVLKPFVISTSERGGELNSQKRDKLEEMIKQARQMRGKGRRKKQIEIDWIF